MFSEGSSRSHQYNVTEKSTTRYDYNLMIMESPKPATDNRFKKINQKLPLKSNNVEFLRHCGGHFENGDL